VRSRDDVRAPARTPRRGPSRSAVVRGIVLVLVLAITAIPLVWIVLTSLTSNLEIETGDNLIPSALTFDNYERLFELKPFGRYMLNSLIVTGVSMTLSLVIGGTAAYSLARFRLWLRLDRHLGLTMLVVRIVPPIVLLVPMYLLVLELGLLNTLTGLILIYTAFGAALVVFMMESFLREIPVDLEEAAQMDGDTRWGALWRIVLPLARPGLVATGVFVTIMLYNEFLFALGVTSTPDAMTVPRGAASLMGKDGIEWGPMAAAGVLAAAPMVMLTVLVQRHLVRGLTFGAIK
jgi:multiple sugar transport system permease protein